MQKFIGGKLIFQNNIIKFWGWNLTGTSGIRFVLPPHAGRHGNIVQNKINILIKCDYVVYTMELLSADQSNKNTSIGDLLMELNRCADTINAPFVLLAVCQGGWLGAMFTASQYNKGRVQKLGTFAAPINIKTGIKNSIEEYCKTIDLDAHRKAIALNNGIQPGWAQWWAFTLSDPIPVLHQQYVDLYYLSMAGNTTGVMKWWRNYNWHIDYQDLAGVWFMEALEFHFKNNDLYEGRWVVNGELIELSKITCSVYTYSGFDDDITADEQTIGLNDKVSSKINKHTCFKGRSIAELAELNIEADEDEKIGHTNVFVKEWCIRYAIDQMA